MSLLRALNPFNTLFGRIFLWFWTAVILMVVITFFVARYFGQVFEVNALQPSELEKATTLVNGVQGVLNRTDDIRLTLRRAGMRGRWQLIAIDPRSKEIISNIPQSLIPQRKKLFDLAKLEQPFSIRTNNMQLAGPFILKDSDVEYPLFVGQLLRRSERPAFAMGSALLVFIILGTAACIGIAYTITKPIRRLQKLSQEFTYNHDMPPDTSLLERKDEIGQVYADTFAMATKLALSLKQQKELMANISHELRTPLTRLQLATAMLEDSEVKNAYLSRIEKEVEVMDKLIGEALRLARFSSHENLTKDSLSTHAIDKVLKPVLEDLNFEAVSQNKSLEIQDCAALENLDLKLSPEHFVSAFENITRNAIKYAQSKVVFSFGVLVEESALELIIEDDGIGIAELNTLETGNNEDNRASTERVFQPFYRAPSGKHKQGTGLGLAIAKAAIDLHKGQLIATRSELGGLLVKIILPV